MIKMDDFENFALSTDDVRSPPCASWTELVETVTNGNKASTSVGINSHSLLKTRVRENDMLRGLTCSTIRNWSIVQKQKASVTTSGYLPNSIVSQSENSEKSGSRELLFLKPAILNSILMYQKNSKELELLDIQNNCYVFINEFILKLQNALKREKQFLHKMNATLDHTDRMNSSSVNSDSDNLSSNPKSKLKKLPKLGKVYAELRSCVKSCDEAEKLWLSQTGFGKSSAFTTLKSRKRVFEYQGRMLLHVRWLIEARLCNLGMLASSHYDDESYDISDLFCCSENKKFCKLFEVYNQYAAAYLKNCDSNSADFLCHCGEQFMSTSNNQASGAPNDFYKHGFTEMNHTLRPNVIYALSVNGILDVLSEEFMFKVGPCLANILKSCRISETSLSLTKHSKHIHRGFNSGFLWEEASKIEVRPVQPPKNHKSSFFRVIKRVAGIGVPDIDMEQTGRYCSALVKLFANHHDVVSLFISAVSGKTKILHRSHNFESHLSDDTMSVASSENRSTASFVRHNESKSVVWRDSWNNDAMKAITTYYSEYLINSLSNFFSLSRSVKRSTSIMMAESQEIFEAVSDIGIILLQAVIVNIGHLNVMEDSLHNALSSTSAEIVVNAALSCSDNMLSEMLGKCSPQFDKLSIQTLPDTDISLSSQYCLASIQPLMYILEFYPQTDTVVQNALPRVEAILTAGFWWIRRKIQEFFSSQNLAPVLTMCLCDLRELTNIGLDCLRLVESLHNHVETKRNQNSAALIIATRHLHNVDSIITNMQVMSGSCMLQLSEETKQVASAIILKLFPPQKVWLQKNRINNEEENDYVQDLINKLFKVAGKAVSKMDSQSQLAGMTPIVNAVFDACLAHIARTKIRFTLQGALQLHYDFSTMFNFLTADISELSTEVRVSLASLHSVKRALHVTDLLQSTSYENEAFVDDRFRPQSKMRSSTSIPNDNDDADAPDEDSEYTDKFWLSLRKHNMPKSKSWTSFLPCVDQK